MAAILLSACSEIVDKNPSASYNFAIMFYFMGCFEEALIICQKSDAKENQPWFTIELLLKTRRYLQALEAIDEMQPSFANDPEAQFSSTYLKAIAYWGLHQGATAIELMQSIVNVRPEYRSAQSLFSKWNGGLR